VGSYSDTPLHFHSCFNKTSNLFRAEESLEESLRISSSTL
jgi:hypothetical protein